MFKPPPSILQSVKINAYLNFNRHCDVLQIDAGYFANNQIEPRNTLRKR